MNEGIADYEALAKATGGDAGVIRELSTAEERRGDVELMKGDITAARTDFDRSYKRIERLARLDPENKMLQADLRVADYHEGRALALAGKYHEALVVLQRALQGYLALHLEADSGPGPGAMQAWVGEAQVGTHNIARALQSFQKAAAIMAPDQATYDDARSDLAVVETKIGDTLIKMGKLREASATYSKALEIANLKFSLEHKDFPAIYAAADAYAGLGDLSAAQARQTQDPVVQSQHYREARAAYEKTLELWKQILNPSRISGNGYLAGDPHQVAIHLGNLPQ